MGPVTANVGTQPSSGPGKFWLGRVLKTSNRPVRFSKPMSAIPKADIDRGFVLLELTLKHLYSIKKS